MTSTYSAPSKVKLVIHHLFPGIELVSPEYACDGAKCHQPPDKRVYFGLTTHTSFKIKFTQGNSAGILMYELKNIRQFNKNAMSSGDGAKCIQLVIIWKVDLYKEFCVYSRLIEHDKRYIWDRDKLMKLSKWCQLFNIVRLK
jgi:hypothetical protein